jgi:hypothetical protein
MTMSKKNNGTNGHSKLVSEIKSIGWMGTPKSGKSKQIKLVQERLKEKLDLEEKILNNVTWKEKFAKGEKGVREYFHMGYLIPLIQAAAEKVLDYKDPSNLKPGYIMLERNAYDFEAFTKTLVEMGYIDQSELTAYLGNMHLADKLPQRELEKSRRFLHKGLLADLARTDDLVIFMKISPEEAMKREAKVAGGPRRGKVMNIPFLTQLNEQYDSLLERMKGEVDVLEIDGSAPLEENTGVIYEAVSQLFLSANYANEIKALESTTA